MNFWIYATYGIGVLFLGIIVFVAVLFLMPKNKKDVSSALPGRIRSNTETPPQQVFDQEKFIATNLSQTSDMKGKRLDSGKGLPTKRPVFSGDDSDFIIVEGKD